MIMLPSVLDKLDDCIVYHTTTAIDDYLARFPSYSKCFYIFFIVVYLCFWLLLNCRCVYLFALTLLECVTVRSFFYLFRRRSSLLPTSSLASFLGQPCDIAWPFGHLTFMQFAIYFRSRGDEEEMMDDDISTEFFRDSHHIHSIPRPQVSQVNTSILHSSSTEYQSFELAR